MFIPSDSLYDRLALGCVSPRYIFWELKRYMSQKKSNTDGPYWIIFELIWRDFFKYAAMKHGNKFFYSYGMLIFYSSLNAQNANGGRGSEFWSQICVVIVHKKALLQFNLLTCMSCIHTEDCFIYIFAIWSDFESSVVQLVDIGVSAGNMQIWCFYSLLYTILPSSPNSLCLPRHDIHICSLFSKGYLHLVLLFFFSFKESKPTQMSQRNQFGSMMRTSSRLGQVIQLIGGSIKKYYMHAF